MSAEPCPACLGRRLKPEALAVKVGGRSIDEVSGRPSRTSIAFFDELQLYAARARDRREDPQGDPGPPRLPGERGHRLPEPRPAARRRSRAASRSASGSPPRSARSSWASSTSWTSRPSASTSATTASYRHAALDARPGQHRHRRRARRGDHPLGRLGPGPRPRRRRPRRTARRARARRRIWRGFRSR